MRLNYIKIFLIAFASILLVSSNIEARQSLSDQQIEVSLRMIGHKVLLCFGDSTSRVLPIEKEDGRYRIKFDTEFQFEPEELVSTITQVIEETKMDYSFIMVVQDCESDDIVYSYQMGDLTNPNITPCLTRPLPKACYDLVFTFLDDEQIKKSFIANNPEAVIEDASEANSMTYPIMAILLIPIIGVFFFLRKKRNQPIKDPNLISLGDYQFNKRKTELTHDQKIIELTSKEANLLILLYDAVNTTMEREVILKQVWGDEGDYVGRTLDVFISKLRKKLEADPKVKIVNIRGVGYKLVIDA